MKPEQRAASLRRLTEICLALPDATHKVTGRHARFHVRGKTFSYFLDDHHGDAIVGVCAKVAAGKNRALIAADARRYYLPAYLGPKGWVGLRLDVGPVDWDDVTELVSESYRLIAPKSLSARIQPR
jgi:predicted DNA-binding protein (MmcQ/YjbR family)